MATDKAAVPGGIVKDWKGRWVDANGQPVDVEKLAPEVQKAIGYTPAKKAAGKGTGTGKKGTGTGKKGTGQKKAE